MVDVGDMETCGVAAGMNNEDLNVTVSTQMRRERSPRLPNNL